MSATLEQLKIGQDITLVSKGIEHGYNDSTWIDHLRAGSASFLKITKVGKKYIYGVYFYFEDGKRKNGYYESKHNMEEYTIYKGVRRDLEDQHRKFRRDYDNYEKRRKEKQRKLEYKLHHQLNAKMEKWELTYPRPKNPAIN